MLKHFCISSLFFLSFSAEAMNNDSLKIEFQKYLNNNDNFSTFKKVSDNISNITWTSLFASIGFGTLALFVPLHIKLLPSIGLFYMLSNTMLYNNYNGRTLRRTLELDTRCVGLVDLSDIKFFFKSQCVDISNINGAMAELSQRHFLSWCNYVAPLRPSKQLFYGWLLELAGRNPY